MSPRRNEQASFDLVTIGSGSAAFAAGIRASSLGAKVAMVEVRDIGGTCVNVGCVPSKALLAAAETYYRAGAHPFKGIATSRWGVDVAALVGAKDEIVSSLRQKKYVDLAVDYGFEILSGRAEFVSPDEVLVGGRSVSADTFVIATGAAPFVPPIPGLSEAGYLTSTTAMSVSALPASLVVIGGNYIGLEMAQLFSHLGTRVSIVEAMDRIAPNEEPEVSNWITQVLRSQGIDILTSATVRAVYGGQPKQVEAEISGQLRRLSGDEILVATGRRPFLEGLGLDLAGVSVDGHGQLVLDDELRTTNPRIYAAGDVTGAAQFVYVAAAQGTLVADNSIGGARRKMDYTALPRVTFTTPAIAGVGLTQAQAEAAGHDCEAKVLPLDQVPRAVVNQDTVGGLKIVAERHSGRLLGISAVADGAGDLILAGVYAIKAGLGVADLAETWAPYLTMAEALKLAAQTFTTDVSKLSCCAA